MIPKEIINEKWIEVVGEEVFNTLEINNEGWLEFNTTRDYHSYNLRYGNKFTVLNYDPWKTGEYSHVQDISIRPSSLRGFEKNKGWIKIESENDLPKESYGQYHVYSENEIYAEEPKKQGVETFWQNDKGKVHEWMDNFTHYQPIEKPQPPLH